MRKGYFLSGTVEMLYNKSLRTYWDELDDQLPIGTESKHLCPGMEFRGIIYYNQVWCLFSSNVHGPILIPGIKFCPFCGEELLGYD